MKRHETHPAGAGTRRRRILFAALLFLTAAILCCCGKKQETQTRTTVSKPEDFNDAKYTIGVISETSSCSAAKESVPKARFREFEAISDAYPFLENGTIDAIAFDRPVLDYAQRTRDVFVVLPDNYAEGHISIAVAPTKPELLKNVNAFLREFFASGLYDNMYARWIKSKNPEMPKIQAPANPYGKLVIGTENTKPGRRLP